MDVTIQAQIIDLVVHLQERLGMAVIWITHDLGVIARLAQRVIVMYAGRIAEEAAVMDLYHSSRHPYTLGLLGSLPRLDAKYEQKLISIHGQPPTMLSTWQGCPFYPRCSYAIVSTIRDLAPIVSGLVAGPYVGLAVGLIGGLHRLTLGGTTCIACSLSTILAGLLSRSRVPFQEGETAGTRLGDVAFAAGIELMHGGIVLAISRPFDQAVEVVVDVIPEMIVAVSLGVGISVIIRHDVIKSEGPESMKKE